MEERDRGGRWRKFNEGRFCHRFEGEKFRIVIFVGGHVELMKS